MTVINMTRKRIFIIIACLVILGAGFYFSNFIKTKKIVLPADQAVAPVGTAAPAINQPAESLTAEQVKQNQESAAEIIKAGALDQCASLSGGFKSVCQYNILTNQAVNNNDNTACARINDELYKKSCYDLVAANKKVGAAAAVKPAENTKSPEEQTKEAVLNGVAYKNLMALYDDQTFKIPAKEFGEFVKVVAYVDQVALCQELPQYWRQDCLERYYLIQAKQADDLAVCDKIATIAWQDECYYQVISARAVIKQSAAVCDQLKAGAARDKCKAQINSFK